MGGWVGGGVAHLPENLVETAWKKTYPLLMCDIVDHLQRQHLWKGISPHAVNGTFGNGYHGDHLGGLWTGYHP